MKKIIIKLLLIIGLISSIFIVQVSASAINIGDINGIEKITNATIEKTGDSDIVTAVNDFGFNILRIAKVILQALLVVFIVYIGGKMIISMGSDEGELTKAKSQIRYSLIAIVFINIPGVIYEAITLSNGNKNINGVGGTFTDAGARNILINMDLFSGSNGVLTNTISALQVFIFIVAIYVIIMAGVKIMTSRGRDEKVKEAKEKFFYSLFAILFVGFIEAWKQVVITGNLSGGSGSATYVFGKLIDISLLFAGPVAIVFLTYAGYLYIFSNGDDEKIKKSKNIIVNTLIAMVLLIIMVTFLNDLITL